MTTTMNDNPHYWIGDEEVNGIIVGGDHCVGGLYYNGRGPLGGKFDADDEAGLMAQARARKRQLIDNGGILIYPDDRLWELRIYG